MMNHRQFQQTSAVGSATDVIQPTASSSRSSDHMRTRLAMDSDSCAQPSLRSFHPAAGAGSQVIPHSREGAAVAAALYGRTYQKPTQPATLGPMDIPLAMPITTLAGHGAHGMPRSLGPTVAVSSASLGSSAHSREGAPAQDHTSQQEAHTAPAGPPYHPASSHLRRIYAPKDNRSSPPPRPGMSQFNYNLEPSYFPAEQEFNTPEFAFYPAPSTYPMQQNCDYQIYSGTFPGGHYDLSGSFPPYPSASTSQMMMPPAQPSSSAYTSTCSTSANSHFAPYQNYTYQPSPTLTHSPTYSDMSAYSLSGSDLASPSSAVAPASYSAKLPYPCQWGQCHILLDDLTTGGIQRHLREHHWHEIQAASPVQCRWDGCREAHGLQLQAASVGKHISAIHLRFANEVKCKFCQQSFGRSDASVRHMKKQHPEEYARWAEQKY